MNWFKNAVGIVGAPFTGGASLGLLDEDLRAGLPIIGPLTGAKSDEQKALEATQRQLAGEQKARMEQQRQVGLQNTANRLMAFAPMNNNLASRGMQAYSPEQMQQLSADPTGGPKASPEVQRWLSLSDQERQHVRNGIVSGQRTIAAGGSTHWSGMTMQQLNQIEQQAIAFSQQQSAEQGRQAQVNTAFQGAPAAPQQIQMSTPLPARRV